MKVKRTLEEIEWEISKDNSHVTALLEGLEILEKEKIAFLRGTRFPCPDCGRRSTLSKWVFIKAHYRDAPLGGIEGDWREKRLAECGIRCPTKCEGVFHIPKLAPYKRGKLLKVMEKAGPTRAVELFKCVEEMEEEDLLSLCK
ncbi:MAG: hypothetical protein AAB497_01355 [Patescibacteria group bacterium]